MSIEQENLMQKFTGRTPVGVFVTDDQDLGVILIQAWSSQGVEVTLEVTPDQAPRFIRQMSNATLRLRRGNAV